MIRFLLASISIIIGVICVVVILSAPAAASTIIANTGPYTITKFAENGQPFRLDPCHTVKWSTVGMPRKEVKKFRKAIKIVTKYSGIKFKHTNDWNNADLKVSFVYDYNSKHLGITHVAYVSGMKNGEYTGYSIIGFGTIDITVRKDFKNTTKLFAHELGHFHGLDHSSNTKSLMYPFNHGGLRLTAGDKAGLRAVGASHGCLGYVKYW